MALALWQRHPLLQPLGVHPLVGAACPALLGHYHPKQLRATRMLWQVASHGSKCLSRLSLSTNARWNYVEMQSAVCHVSKTKFWRKHGWLFENDPCKRSFHGAGLRLR